MSAIEIKNIYRWIKSIYPLKNELPTIAEIKTISDLSSLKLSHFTIVNAFNIEKCLTIDDIKCVKIDGNWITTNEYMNRIVNTIEYRNLSFFLENPNAIPECNLSSLKIEELCTNTDTFKPHYRILSPTSNSKTNMSNHFTFPSLDLRTDSKIIAKELDRLIKTRNKHKMIHFHLNEGGDMDVVHTILRCLCGEKEEWMKPFTIYDSEYNHENDTTHKITIIPQKHDPWQEFSYKDKYSGKIILHVNLKCASSSWYLITYLIYAFSDTITRETIRIHGKKIKVGRVTGNIIIDGYSSTSSGDSLGEEKDIQQTFTIFNKKTTIRAPSKALITSVHKQDYNRFWLPNS
jgi:hypothetical protein